MLRLAGVAHVRNVALVDDGVAALRSCQKIDMHVRVAVFKSVCARRCVDERK